MKRSESGKGVTTGIGKKRESRRLEEKETIAKTYDLKRTSLMTTQRTEDRPRTD